MIDYASYLCSPQWRHKRNQMIALVGASCEFCGDEFATLQVHHLTYETLGHESDLELAVLCEHCHKDFHDGLLPDLPDLIARRRRAA